MADKASFLPNAKDPLVVRPSENLPKVIAYAIDSRWFALGDLACACIATSLWYAIPEARAAPLLIGLFPWAVRIAAGRFPFQRTRLDLPVFAFAFAAAIGVWAAYDREIAWARFWLFVGGILIYHALAGQPRANLWLITGFVGSVGLGMAVYFLLTHDWASEAPRIAVLDEIGIWWMSVRPSLGLEPIQRNGAAAVMATMTPFLIAVGIQAWRDRRELLVILGVAATSLVLIALLLTTSRGAWVALGVTFGLWLFWGVSHVIARVLRWKRGWIFALSLLYLLFLMLFLAMTYPGGVVELAHIFPGPDRADERLHLADSALALVGDFPFTGGGLGSFSGLYSRYVLLVPFFLVEHGHNLMLDIAQEMGLLGLMAFVALLLGGSWLLISHLRRLEVGAWSDRLLGWAAITALLIMAVHGLVDFSDQGAPLFFLVLGMIISVPQSAFSGKSTSFRSTGDDLQKVRSPHRRGRKGLGFLGLGILSAILLIASWKALLAGWYANMGALGMARIELADWPMKEWDESIDVGALGPTALALYQESLASGSRTAQYRLGLIAMHWNDDPYLESLGRTEELFREAIHLQPSNRTANHRLGYIAMLRRDFPTAVLYLERALEADSHHRGISKALGYAYIWSGRFDQAAEILEVIPEAHGEMSLYSWWWELQGREDLAANAGAMAARLQESDRFP
jgi:hypothetical protein